MAAEYKEISPNAPAGEQLLNWIDNRFPLTKLYKEHLSEYYAPKNLNFWYFFGSLALLVLVIQIISGIFLVMHYKPDATLNAAGVPVAFASVEYIMREVEWGWLIRYIHSTGASFFFIVVYMHMFRGLIYGSYRKPRELIWLFGCGILLVMMAIAFTGYLLPWGQMSFWGAAVIVNLFVAIPIIGPDLALLIRGDFVVGDATLNRFFSLHVIALPLVLLGLVVAHIIALHEVGSNNPDGIEIKKHKDANGKPLDGIPFHPYYSVHDLMGVGVFLMIFSAVVFFAPSGGGFFLKYTNLIPADPLVTPAHIAPVWYFAPYYSMLRAVTTEFMYVLVAGVWLAAFIGIFRSGFGTVGKGLVLGGAVVGTLAMLGLDAMFWGVVVMGAAVVILCFLPWLDRAPVASIRYRPTWNKYLYGAFVVNFAIMGYFGVLPPSVISTRFSQFGTLFYLGFFLLMPWWSRLGEFKPVPSRVSFTPH
ncbi:MAG: cytochrome bc complex cytochrome b subunit [Betaproteobacteria bacterium]|nr:cytochrome bc complex cytochrome b subunit [Betaproteobacteria bacterium]